MRRWRRCGRGRAGSTGSARTSGCCPIFALGKALSDIGRDEESFRHLLAGNALKRRTTAYDEAATLGVLEEIRHVFTAELMQRCGGAGHPSRLPIFIARAGGAPQGEAGPSYPGTCRRLGRGERAEKLGFGTDYALRLDLGQALALTGPFDWVEEGGGAARRVEAEPAPLGDAVLARKEFPASYHLAVTVDDAIQGVTLVTRGEDLAPATRVHRVLRALLGLPTPRYRHHQLLTDESGRRLAKRDRAMTVRSMRASGMSPVEILARAGSRQV